MKNIEKQMPVDYSKGKIYQICSAECEEVYIGSTTQSLSVRMGGHRKDYKAWDKTNHYKSSFEILQYPDAKIFLVEDYPCENKEQLERREGQIIRETVCVNKHVAGRTKREYRKENENIIREKKHKYYENNKEKCATKSKEYYKNNKIAVRECAKEYYENNKEKLAIQQKEYYENNKEKIKSRVGVKITCECGSGITKAGLSQHRKTNKHINFLKSRV